ncbi:hypothetical protein DCC81_20195 [Chitinophaga parva]|uniref:RNA polymerase sigma-70 factor n=1 Tax=Chitinophaga parva TaxID=2169414 RepID=A0A2T7BCF8_9BACT|nr:RNA polymerase sigma-70 factor [Chitinophaga parva]PUZ22752.1 hypothetical protein DCC81_20195 [Chitinophaga parva]
MDSMPPGDVWVRRMREGDEAAFTQLYRQYHPALYLYLLRYCKIPSLAEDLVHDVFLKLWEVRERIDPAQSFTGYLYRIARNHVFKTIQRIATDEALRAQVCRNLESRADTLPEDQVADKQYERLFEEALDRMPPQRLRVFRLCRQEGRSYEEAADMLGISRNAVKKHMVLGMRFIYEYVHRYGDVLALGYLLVHLF